MYKYVLFDLDGTISDSSEGITKAVQKSLSEMGIEVQDRGELYKFIGPPLSYSYSKFFGFDDAQCEEAIRRYRAYYSVKGLYENTPYAGIEDLLKKIKASGRKVAVTTSKPDKFTIQILEHFGFLDLFDFVACASMDESRNKKHEVVEYCLAQMGITDKREVVLVGDTRFDAEGAARVGIDCIGVLYGFGSREELEKSGATYLAETVEDIYQYL